MGMDKLKVMTIFGTRPEAIKMAPLVKELERREGIESLCCVPGAQPRLHVAHGDLLVKRRQRPGKGGGGVPMDQHQVGPHLLKHLFQPQQALGGDGGQGLAGLHDIQGFIMATMSVEGMFKQYTIISFVVPFLMLGLPIFDVCLMVDTPQASPSSPSIKLTELVMARIQITVTGMDSTPSSAGGGGVLCLHAAGEGAVGKGGSGGRAQGRAPDAPPPHPGLDSTSMRFPASTAMRAAAICTKNLGLAGRA